MKGVETTKQPTRHTTSTAATPAPPSSSSRPSPLVRFRSLLPRVASARLERDQTLLFGLVATPAIVQLLFHLLTQSASSQIQRLGIEPDDLFKPATTSEFTTFEESEQPIHSILTNNYAKGIQSPTMTDTILPFLALTATISKGAFQALAVIYPSYKTFKALESRSLRASQAMLLYWCITAFVNSIKEFSDQIFGNYANFFVWKLTIVILKALPLIVGPDRLYDAVVKPFYEKHEEKIDAVVDEAHRIKEMAKEAVPAVKEGDLTSVKDQAVEIAQVVQEDATDLVASISQKAIEMTDTIQAKTIELGNVLDDRGIRGVMERTMTQVEKVRDFVQAFVSQQWSRHGPTIRRQMTILAQKIIKYSILIKEKAIETYTRDISPRLLPLRMRYQEQVRPWIQMKADRVRSLWIDYGGPIRRAYSNQLRPFFRNTVEPTLVDRILPWVVDSFLPAVVETLISMKDGLVDLASAPSDEVKQGRARHKHRRAEARKEKKRNRLDLTNSRAAKDQSRQSQPESQSDRVSASHAPSAAPITGGALERIYEEDQSADVGSSEPSSPSPVSNAATLHNRKSKQSMDSTLQIGSKSNNAIKADQADQVAIESTLNPDASPFEPSQPSTPTDAAAVESTSKVTQPQSLDLDSDATKGTEVSNSTATPNKSIQSKPLDPKIGMNLINSKRQMHRPSEKEASAWEGEPRSQTYAAAAAAGAAPE